MIKHSHWTDRTARNTAFRLATGDGSDISAFNADALRSIAEEGHADGEAF